MSGQKGAMQSRPIAQQMRSLVDRRGAKVVTAPDALKRTAPPRWNAAPSQELLVIPRNHKTGHFSARRDRRGAKVVSAHGWKNSTLKRAGGQRDRPRAVHEDPGYSPTRPTRYHWIRCVGARSRAGARIRPEAASPSTQNVRRAPAADIPRCLSLPACIVPVNGFIEWKAIKGAASEAAVRYSHEGRCALRGRWHLGKLERACFQRVDSNVCHPHR